MIDLSSKFMVKSFSISKTKKGDPMGNLILQDHNSNSTLDCKIWSNFLDKISPIAFRAGNIVQIEGDFNYDYNNCIIKNIKIIEKAPIGLNEKAREHLFNKIISVINEFKDEKLKKAVLKEIMTNEYLFKTVPAAKVMHHNYLGGLMQHTWECIEFAKVTIPLFKQNVDNDQVIAACIMHDIGKMFEYEINIETGIVEIIEDFRTKWINHTQYAFCWAMNNDFKNIARMIAAHHGRSEWDALIDLGERNLESELYLVHHIDDLSAKFGLIRADMIKDL